MFIADSDLNEFYNLNDFCNFRKMKV